jgi:hypothetical protein
MVTSTMETPFRISSHQYTIRSSKGDRSYDLIFDETRRRWICNCPDARDPQAENHYVGNSNPNCKHVRRLREYIAQAKQAQQQQEAQALEEAKAVITASQQESRIKNLESYTAKIEAALDQACQLIQQQALELELLKTQMAEQKALLDLSRARQTIHIDADEIVIRVGRRN